MNFRSLLFVPALVLVAGCAPEKPVGLSVVASIYPLGFVAERIAGTGATVTVVTPFGSEPHEFEPTPSAIAAATDAELFVFNGGGIDPWAERVAAGRDARRTVKATGVVGGVLPSDDEEVGEGINPHVWLDPNLLIPVAMTIADRLGTIDPDHALEYNERAAALIVDLQRLDQEIVRGLSHCERQDIIVAHDAYAYFAKRYRLTVHPLAGLSPEEEATPATVLALQSLAETKGIHDVFVERLSASNTLRSIASDINGRVLILDPIEGLAADSPPPANYLSLMRQNLAVLQDSLSCR